MLPEKSPLDAINEWVPTTSEIPPPYTFEPREKEIEKEVAKEIDVDDNAVQKFIVLLEMT